VSVFLLSELLSIATENYHSSDNIIDGEFNVERLINFPKDFSRDNRRVENMMNRFVSLFETLSKCN
jgi:hypothetical protein